MHPPDAPIALAALSTPAHRNKPPERWRRPRGTQDKLFNRQSDEPTNGYSIMRRTIRIDVYTAVSLAILC